MGGILVGVSGRVPPLIFLECDYGADWPTWVPNHEPPHRGRERTDYYPLDGLELSPVLRENLLSWQRRWERLVPPVADDAVDESEWQAFLSEGRGLAAQLQLELGEGVEVRVRMK